LRLARAVEAMGAAVVVEDRPGDPATWRDLAAALEALTADERRRCDLANQARAAGRPEAAETIAAVVLELADGVTERRHLGIRSDRKPSPLGPGR
jgi:UDP-N-acetylglucosamine:LPS N-acetylglucosamine transferase